MVGYVHGHTESVLRSHRWRTAANSAAYLLDDLAPGLDVLDVGCGPGTITTDLAELVAPGRVVGIDTSRDVLLKASEFAGARGVENIIFEPADVMELPYADQSFDVVHAHQVLQHLPEPVSALREMRRVLRPGGVLAVRDADYGAMAWYPQVPALSAWQELYHQVARSGGGEPDAGRRLLHWVQQAGFTDVEPTASTWLFADQERREKWGHTWADRLQTSALADHAIELGLADSARLAELAEGWREWAASGDGWFLVPHGEVRARR